MREGALLGWPLWTSLGIHVVGLATAGSVVALARHEPERVLIPVEIVRVEPPRPPAPPEEPKMPRQITRPSPVVRSTSIPQPLMPDPTPRTERPPDPAAASPERRYMASADATGPAARVTRLRDRLAGPAAVRARARDRQETLLVAQLTGAAALRARFGAGAVGGGLGLWMARDRNDRASLLAALFLATLAVIVRFLARMHRYDQAEAQPSGRATLIVSDLLHKRRSAEMLIDMLLFAVAYRIAFDGFGANVPRAADTAGFLALVVFTKIAALSWAGAYHSIWDRGLLSELGTVGGALLLVSIAACAVAAVLAGTSSIVRMSIVDLVIGVCLAAAARGDRGALPHLAGGKGLYRAARARTRGDVGENIIGR